MALYEQSSPPTKDLNRLTIFSSVRTYLDMTNQHVGHIIKLRLSETYMEFSKDLLNSCGIPPDLVNMMDITFN